MLITKKNEVKLEEGVTLLKVADINNIYEKLKNREINPRGHFDSGGRWYAKNDDLVACIREPSRNWPYSKMIACRSLKYVIKVIEKHKCIDKKDFFVQLC